MRSRFFLVLHATPEGRIFYQAVTEQICEVWLYISDTIAYTFRICIFSYSDADYFLSRETLLAYS